MSILITTDIHLTSNPEHAYRWKIFDELKVQANLSKDEVTHFIVAGDLTEQKSGHSSELVNRMVKEFRDLADVAAIHILAGNHDYEPGGEMFFKFLRYIRTGGRVRVFDHIGNAHLGNECVLYVPNAFSIEQALEVKGMMTRKPDVAILHHSFKGVRTANGYTMPNGEEVSGVKALAPLIFSGDIHTRQKHGPVEYIGTPYPIDFDEQHECRIIHIADDRKVRSLPVNIMHKLVIEVGSLKELAKELRDMVGGQVKVRWRMSTADLSRSSELYQQVTDVCQQRKVSLTGGVEFLITDQPDGGIDSVVVKDKTDMATVAEVLEGFIKMKRLKKRLATTGRRIAKS